MSWNPFTRMFHQFKIKGFSGSKYGWMEGRICSSKSSCWSKSKFLLTRKVCRSPPKRQNTTEASRLSSMVFNGQPLDSSLRRYPPGPHRVRQMYRRTQKNDSISWMAVWVKVRATAVSRATWLVNGSVSYVNTRIRRWYLSWNRFLRVGTPW